MAPIVARQVQILYVHFMDHIVSLTETHHILLTAWAYPLTQDAQPRLIGPSAMIFTLMI